MIVSVTDFSGCDTNDAASTTSKFLMSWQRFHASSTDFFGSVSHARAARFVRHAAHRIRISRLKGIEFRSGNFQYFFHLCAHLIANRKRMVIFGVGMKAHLWNSVAIRQSFAIDLHVIGSRAAVLLRIR